MDKGRIIRPVATKQNTEENVIQRILKQNNFSDVIFLIEQEVYLHGIRDLSKNNSTNYFKYFSSKWRGKSIRKD